MIEVENNPPSLRAGRAPCQVTLQPRRARADPTFTGVARLIETAAEEYRPASRSAIGLVELVRRYEAMHSSSAVPGIQDRFIDGRRTQFSRRGLAGNILQQS